MSKKKIGPCHLCRQIRTLTKEHIPPRSTNNYNTRYTEGNFLEFMESKNPLTEKVKGKFKQGGIGFDVFCGTCNKFLGDNYVRTAYKNWVDGGLLALKELNEPFSIADYSLDLQSPREVIKQIISMFLGINDAAFSRAHPELSKFVLNPESTDLPEDFRVFAYLHGQGNYRYNPITIVGNIVPQSVIVCSEISFPPFGYVLTHKFKGKFTRHLEITHFKDYELNASTHLDLQMHNLPTHVPICLDYRSKEQIQKGIEEGQKLRGL